MTSEHEHSSEHVNVAGVRLRVLKAGSGPPLLVLHQDIGNPGWLPFHQALAERHTVYVPDFPGWGESERATWMRSVRDLAVVLHHLEDRLGLEEISLVGLGLGGWAAAEMATMDQRRYRRLALVGPCGLQPEEGEILDQFIVAYDEYVRTGFKDAAAYEAAFDKEADVETLMSWDLAREMVARIAWKPYLFSQTLPYLLGELRLPTLVAWGRHDRVVPPTVAQQFAKAIPGARVELFDAGHYVEFEQPAALAAAILGAGR